MGGFVTRRVGCWREVDRDKGELSVFGDKWNDQVGWVCASWGLHDWDQLRTEENSDSKERGCTDVIEAPSGEELESLNPYSGEMGFLYQDGGEALVAGPCRECVEFDDIGSVVLREVTDIEGGDRH